MLYQVLVAGEVCYRFDGSDRPANHSSSRSSSSNINHTGMCTGSNTCMSSTGHCSNTSKSSSNGNNISMSSSSSSIASSRGSIISSSSCRNNYDSLLMVKRGLRRRRKLLVLIQHLMKGRHVAVLSLVLKPLSLIQNTRYLKPIEIQVISYFWFDRYTAGNL